MKKIALLLAGSLFLFSVQAADWKTVSQNAERTVMMDMSSVRKNGTDVAVWTKTDLARSRPVQAEPNTPLSGKTFKSVHFLNNIRCPDRKITMLAIVTHDERGNTVTSQQIARPVYRDIVPDSVSDVLYKSLCARRAPVPPPPAMPKTPGRSGNFI
ncbi:MAG: hypothetical protein LBK01_00360 [Burkholderiaceae bacterium]|jgi:hypothetical protein|nr:hypothetical protein [Burkholderiaceae bacterium]